MLPTKFQFIWMRVFTGEDLNVKSKRMTDTKCWQKLILPLARFAKKNIKCAIFIEDLP
jgi:hypothetical protein